LKKYNPFSFILIENKKLRPKSTDDKTEANSHSTDEYAAGSGKQEITAMKYDMQFNTAVFIREVEKFGFVLRKYKLVLRKYKLVLQKYEADSQKYKRDFRKYKADIKKTVFDARHIGNGFLNIKREVLSVGFGFRIVEIWR
jgi:hypothetical protein